jgi:hypothetical protein
VQVSSTIVVNKPNHLAHLGAYDLALDELEREFDNRAAFREMLYSLPAFQPLHGNPRFCRLRTVPAGIESSQASRHANKHSREFQFPRAASQIAGPHEHSHTVARKVLTAAG